MRDVIVDMDIGIDDAIALMLLTAAPDVRIAAVGTVHGNVDAVVGAGNAIRVLDACGVTDVPVAVGATRPLVRPAVFGPEVHGEDGLGGVRPRTASREPEAISAPDLMVRLARERPGELEILATGPLTNLAMALVLEPRLPELIRRVVVMGGAASGVGNMSAVAEANIWKDPEAASLVFDVSWPVTMIGLDVTMATILDEEAIAAIAASEAPRARLASAMLPYYLDFYRMLGSERRVCPLHDPTATAVFLDSGLIRHSVRTHVSVALDDHARGMTVVDRRSHGGPGRTAAEPASEVVLEVDSGAVVSRLVAALTGG